jgi:hypothetical protein
MFISLETPTYKKLNKRDRQLLERGNFTSIDDCQTKIPTIYQGAFGIFHGMSNCISLFPRFLTVPWMGNTSP